MTDQTPEIRPSEAAEPAAVVSADDQVLAPTWFFVLFIATMIGLGYTLLPFLADIVASFVLVALFQSTFRKIRSAVGGRSWLASSITTSWIVLVVAIPVVATGYSLALEALAAVDSSRLGMASPEGLSAMLNRGRDALASVGLRVTDEHMSRLTAETASHIQGFVLRQATAALNSGVTVVVHFTIVIVIVLYLFVDGHKLKRFVFDLSPLPDEEEELLFRKFVGVSRGILVGNGVGSVLQGILGGIAIWVVGLPAPILWGAVMTLFAFLPIVGISLVVIPATLFLVANGKLITAALFFAFCMGQALVLENVVKTKLIGAQTRMHDLLVFLTIIGGLAGFGLLGLLYGPMLAVCFLTLADLYRRTYRHAAAARLGRPRLARDSG